MAEEIPQLCPNAAHAPRGCGKYNIRYVEHADGKRKTTWYCSFCFDQHRPKREPVSEPVTLGEERSGESSF